jgi:hypothetical protein
MDFCIWEPEACGRSTFAYAELFPFRKRLLKPVSNWGRLRGVETGVATRRSNRRRYDSFQQTTNQTRILGRPNPPVHWRRSADNMEPANPGLSSGLPRVMQGQNQGAGAGEGCPDRAGTKCPGLT